MRVAKEKKEKPIPEMPSKDALEFMKKMGVNMEGMEHEVQDIWKMLNDMSTNDPLQYQKFVDDQISNFREAEVMKGKVESEGGGGNGFEDDVRHFRPNAGFVFSCTTTSGDGLIVREAGKGKTLYVNICHSNTIEKPKDGQGKEVTMYISSTSGLEIPLVVSSIRDVGEEEAIAVDVVMHESVVKECAQDRRFKRDVSKLALDSVMIETKIEAKDFSPIDGCIYKGGRGEGKDVPVLFPLRVGANGEVTTMRAAEEEQEQKQKLQREAMNSPSSFLNVKKAEASSMAPPAISTTKENTSNISVGKKEANNDVGPAKVLIQEVIDDELEPLYVVNNIGGSIHVHAHKNKTKQLIDIVVSNLLVEHLLNMDLHVSKDTIVVTLGKSASDQLKIEAKGCSLDKTKVSAKKGKKSGKLSVQCPFSEPS